MQQYLITNVLKIPDHIVLPNDKVQMEHQYTTEDEQQLDMEVQQLKDQILAVCIIQTSIYSQTCIKRSPLGK